MTIFYRTIQIFYPEEPDSGCYPGLLDKVGGLLTWNLSHPDHGGRRSPVTPMAMLDQCRLLESITNDNSNYAKSLRSDNINLITA